MKQDKTTPTNTIQEHFFWSGYTLMRDNKDKFSSTHVLELINPKSGDKEFISKALNEYPKLIEVVKELRQQLQYMVNLSYPSANPTKSEIYHNIDLSNEAIKKSKEILP